MFLEEVRVLVPTLREAEADATLVLRDDDAALELRETEAALELRDAEADAALALRDADAALVPREADVFALRAAAVFRLPKVRLPEKPDVRSAPRDADAAVRADPICVVRISRALVMPLLR